MDKRRCILNYAQRQTPIDLSTLGFPIIKTDKQFKKSYSIHDMACAYVVHQYQQRKYTIHPIGLDLREHRVIIKDELPDYFAEKDDEVFCFDVKSKSSTRHFGWVNERAIINYRKLSKECDVPVYLIFVQVIVGYFIGEVGYSDIWWKPKVRNYRAWDGNRVWMFNWKKGLP